MMKKEANKMQKKVYEAVAKLAFRHSEKMANSACFFWDYQPKMPNSVKSLKNHK